MPHISYYFEQKDYDQINRLLGKVLGFNLIPRLPIAIGGICISSDIVRIVAGSQYSAASPVLQILLFGFIFSLVGGSFLGNAILLPSKQERYYMIVCCITAVINVIGNYIFIPMFGAQAAAGTTAVCSISIMILLFLKVDKGIKIERIANLLIGPVIGSAVIAGICLTCKGIDGLWLRAIVSIVLSVAVYGLLQIIFKNDLVIEMLGIVKRKIRR